MSPETMNYCIEPDNIVIKWNVWKFRVCMRVRLRSISLSIKGLGDIY